MVVWFCLFNGQLAHGKSFLWEFKQQPRLFVILLKTVSPACIGIR